ncbi:MAG: DUF4249 domain-containing protein [Flavobacterium sp.]|nr:DUF4249 domain-containing protein [Flavobacterium sp.]
MKKIFSLFVLVLFASCQDVVDVDLDTSNPRLVIDANILWQKGTSGNEQVIKLSTTTDYYSNTVPAVTGATVFVTNSANTVFNFVDVANNGQYVCSNFVPVINETYTLTVQYNGVTYNATEKLLATPTIDYVEQTTVQGIGEDLIQVKFFFQDNGLEDNNYLVTVQKEPNVIPEQGVIEDRFFQGNQMFGFYTDQDLEAGNNLKFRLLGISRRYYNYMNKLINITSSGGNPFATPPATLRGNIINQNNENDYPFGYFHLSEIDTKNYTIE